MTEASSETYKDRISKDLKTALLAGDRDKAEVLRGLKSAILYVEVAKGARDSGLPEEEVLGILSKEAKKRQESADLYSRGGNSERTTAELSEKAIIDAYLPKQLSDSEIIELIDKVITENGPISKETMGSTIAAVKAKAAGGADGAVVARLVKERIAA